MHAWPALGQPDTQRPSVSEVHKHICPVVPTLPRIETRRVSGISRLSGGFLSYNEPGGCTLCRLGKSIWLCTALIAALALPRGSARAVSGERELIGGCPDSDPNSNCWDYEREEWCYEHCYGWTCS